VDVYVANRAFSRVRAAFSEGAGAESTRMSRRQEIEGRRIYLEARAIIGGSDAALRWSFEAETEATKLSSRKKIRLMS